MKEHAVYHTTPKTLQGHEIHSHFTFIRNYLDIIMLSCMKNIMSLAVISVLVRCATAEDLLCPRTTKFKATSLYIINPKEVVLLPPKKQVANDFFFCIVCADASSIIEVCVDFGVFNQFAFVEKKDRVFEAMTRHSDFFYRVQIHCPVCKKEAGLDGLSISINTTTYQTTFPQILKSMKPIHTFRFPSKPLQPTTTDRWQCFDDLPITGVLAIPLNSSKSMTVHCATCDWYGKRRLHCQDDNLERASEGALRGAFSYKCLQEPCLKRNVSSMFNGGLREKSCLWKPRDRAHYMSSLDFISCSEITFDGSMAFDRSSWTLLGLLFGAAISNLILLAVFSAFAIYLFNAGRKEEHVQNENVEEKVVGDEQPLNNLYSEYYTK